jgi:hypothetical protein
VVELGKKNRTEINDKLLRNGFEWFSSGKIVVDINIIEVLTRGGGFNTIFSYDIDHMYSNTVDNNISHARYG